MTTTGNIHDVAAHPLGSELLTPTAATRLFGAWVPGWWDRWIADTPQARAAQHQASPFHALEVALGRGEFEVEHFYYGWGGPDPNETTFNRPRALAALERGARPMVTWEPWDYTQGLNQTGNLANIHTAIAGGVWDSYIDQEAAIMRNLGGEVWLRWGHEMNVVNVYPWGFTDPGPTPAVFAAAYVASYRRIVDRFRAAGATNVKHIWCPNEHPDATAPNPSFAAMYPGDNYVDFVGFDSYNWNSPPSGWRTPTQVLDRTYRLLTEAPAGGIASSRPVIICEIGTEGTSAQRVTWIGQLGTYLAGLDRLYTLVWFSENVAGHGNWQLDFDASTLTAARAVFPPAGATNVLYLHNGADFPEEGGLIRIGGGDPGSQILRYATIQEPDDDDDLDEPGFAPESTLGVYGGFGGYSEWNRADTDWALPAPLTDPGDDEVGPTVMTLTTPLAEDPAWVDPALKQSWPEGTRVELWDPVTNFVSQQWRAVVRPAGSEDNSDAIDAILSFPMVLLVPDGVRDDESSEIAVLDDSTGDWVVTDIRGQMPRLRVRRPDQIGFVGGYYEVMRLSAQTLAPTIGGATQLGNLTSHRFISDYVGPGGTTAAYQGQFDLTSGVWYSPTIGEYEFDLSVRFANWGNNQADIAAFMIPAQYGTRDQAFAGVSRLTWDGIVSLHGRWWATESGTGVVFTVRHNNTGVGNLTIDSGNSGSRLAVRRVV